MRFIRVSTGCRNETEGAKKERTEPKAPTEPGFQFEVEDIEPGGRATLVLPSSQGIAGGRRAWIAASECESVAVAAYRSR